MTLHEQQTLPIEVLMRIKPHIAMALAFVCILIVAPVSHATQTRVDSMGGGIKHWTIDDEVNVFDFPSLLVNYGNQAYIDNLTLSIDDEGNPSYPNMRFGYHAQLGDDMVFAIYGGVINSNTRDLGDGFSMGGNAVTGSAHLGVGGQASAAPFVDPGPADESMVGDSAANNVDFNLGMMYALQLGANMRLGVMLNLFRDNGDVELPEGDGKVDRGAWLMDLGVGFGMELEGVDMDFNVGMTYGSIEDYRDVRAYDVDGAPISDQFGNPVYVPMVEHWIVDSHMAIRANGRAVVDFYGDTKLVPYFGLSYISQEISHGQTPDGAWIRNPIGTWDGLDFVVGTDVRIEPFKDVVVSPGLGIRLVQQTREGRQNQQDPVTGRVVNVQEVVTDRDLNRKVSGPFYGIAVDVKVLDWMDFRFGASQSVDFYESATATNLGEGIQTLTEHSEVVTHVATGLGFNVPVEDSVLRMDINVNPLQLLRIPHLWSGETMGAIANNGQYGVSASIQYDW